jgi:hypothetical protein
MKRTHLLLAILLLWLQACVPLDHVHTFSANACDVLASTKDLDYSFKTGYLKYSLNGADTDFSLKPPEPDTAKLRLFTQADATISLFQNTLIAYFAALGQLSDPSLGQTDFSKLGATLKADGKLLHEFPFTADQIDAGVSLSQFIANALTHHYKEKKIREIILKDTTNVRIVLDALSKSLGLLQRGLRSDKGTLTSKYLLLVTDQKIDRGMRILFVREYQQEMVLLEHQNQALESQRQGLSVLKADYQELAARLKENKLTTAAIITLVQQYSADLRTIYDDIKKLKK